MEPIEVNHGPRPCPTCGARGTETCVRGRKPRGGMGIVGAIWLPQKPFPQGHDSRRTANKIGA